MNANSKRAVQASRRDVLHLGALGACGLTLPLLLNLRAAQANDTGGRGAKSFGKAKSCILIFHYGGPPHQDTYDLKPDSPAEVRGEFQPIATSVPGNFICEHMPRMAAQMHRVALVRSVSHNDTQHNNAAYKMLTGHNRGVLADTVAALASPKPDDHPPFGAVLTKLRDSPAPWVSLPYEMINGVPYPGQTAGFLGARFEPLWMKGTLNLATYSVPGLDAAADVNADRLHDRAGLLTELDRSFDLAARSAPARDMKMFQARALDLLTSAALQRAIRLDQEDTRSRERYGRTVIGQSCLLARRLVQAGLPLMTIYTIGADSFPPDFKTSWDTHENNFTLLKQRILPIQDVAFATLLDDLAERGLLDETLVVSFGEFGRTPTINRARAGRDHWPFVFSAVFAGGGIQPGIQFGSSDKIAAYPASNPVNPPDIAATIYHCLGIDPETRITDPQGRPHEVASGGEPIQGILL